MQPEIENTHTHMYTLEYSPEQPGVQLSILHEIFTAIIFIITAEMFDKEFQKPTGDFCTKYGYTHIVVNQLKLLVCLLGLFLF